MVSETGYKSILWLDDPLLIMSLFVEQTKLGEWFQYQTWAQVRLWTLLTLSNTPWPTNLFLEKFSWILLNRTGPTPHRAKESHPKKNQFLIRFFPTCFDPPPVFLNAFEQTFKNLISYGLTYLCTNVPWKVFKPEQTKVAHLWNQVKPPTLPEKCPNLSRKVTYQVWNLATPPFPSGKNVQTWRTKKITKVLNLT